MTEIDGTKEIDSKELYSYQIEQKQDNKVVRKLKEISWWKRQIIAICLGQMLSLCLTSCGVTSQSLATFYSVRKTNIIKKN